MDPCRAAASMAEELPGFVPQVLRLEDVSLLRAGRILSPESDPMTAFRLIPASLRSRSAVLVGPRAY